jgi:hypothetical protein
MIPKRGRRGKGAFDASIKSFVDWIPEINPLALRALQGA